jgi:hypothetical protein
MKKPAHKSKLMWIGFLVMVLGYVYNNFSILQNVIDPKTYGYLLMGIGLIVQIIRYFYTDKDLK